MVTYARKVLVRTGKMCPFIICAIVCLSYCESLASVTNDNYVQFYGFTSPYTPISCMIGQYFEYDGMTIVFLFVLSFAFETCYWNKISVIYLWLQLFEKDYLFNNELYKETICVICVINIVVSAFLVIKGLSKI